MPLIPGLNTGHTGHGTNQDGRQDGWLLIAGLFPYGFFSTKFIAGLFIQYIHGNTQVSKDNTHIKSSVWVAIASICLPKIQNEPISRVEEVEDYDVEPELFILRHAQCRPGKKCYCGVQRQFKDFCYVRFELQRKCFDL